jgi:hypothetical protein
MKIVVTAVVIVGILYGAYTFAVAGWHWFQVSSAIDDVVEMVLPSMADRSDAVTDKGPGIERIRSQILRRVNEIGVPISERDLAVYEENRLLEVRAKWAHTLLAPRRDMVVTLPMTIERSFNLR